ncbi:MAG: conjugal transfer protein TraI [Chitinophagaceae bacterium]|nr:conjugal transfer protein TraI [Chitinophagaceae bacterium]
MKKILVLTATMVMLAIAPVPTRAQIPIVDIIKKGVAKVIKAIDLQIQRQQNKVIWLQNAQKTLENTMSKLKLQEISDWTEKQKELYQGYFDELHKVKTIISYYHRIKEITQMQVRIVENYKRAWGLLQQDKHFTADELAYMQKVYSGILAESINNLDRLLLVINSFQLQMSDAKRLELIHAAAEGMETNYHDLDRFNRQNMMLSLQRARTQKDVEVVKKLYGLK